MNARSWRPAPRSPVALRWLWRRLMVAYVLCPVVTIVIVALGRGHRLAAAVLMVTAYLGTHVYAVACGLHALGRPPMDRATGPFWDDTLLVGLLALPVLIALGRFSDEPTEPQGWWLSASSWWPRSYVATATASSHPTRATGGSGVERDR